MASAETEKFKARCTCGILLSIAAAKAGKKIRCPKCKSILAVTETLKLQPTTPANTNKGVAPPSEDPIKKNQDPVLKEPNSVASQIESKPEKEEHAAEQPEPAKEFNGTAENANLTKSLEEADTAFVPIPKEISELSREQSAKIDGLTKADDASESGVFLADDDFFEIEERHGDPGSTSSYSLDGGEVISNAQEEAEKAKSQREEFKKRWGAFNPEERTKTPKPLHPSRRNSKKGSSRNPASKRAKLDAEADGELEEAVQKRPFNVERYIIPVIGLAIAFVLLLGFTLGWFQLKTYYIWGIEISGKNPLVWIGGVAAGGLLFFIFWIIHTFFFVHLKKKKSNHDGQQIDEADLKLKGSGRRRASSERNRVAADPQRKITKAREPRSPSIKSKKPELEDELDSEQILSKNAETTNGNNGIRRRRFKEKQS